MKFELIHDTIARQVFEKASTEARTRRKVEKFIRERFESYQTRKAKLTQDDIDFINPWLEQVNISPEEKAFVIQAKKALLAGRRQRRMMVAGVITVLITLLLVAIGQWRAAALQKEEALSQKRIAEEKELEAQKQKNFALEKEKEAREIADSLAMKEIELQVSLNAARNARDTAEVRRKEAELAKIRADLQTQLAEEARIRAENSDRLARLQADTARMEKQNAERAEAMALQEARSSSLSAMVMKFRPDDKTLALRLAGEAARAQNPPNPLAESLFSELLESNETHCYAAVYQKHTEPVLSLAVSSDGKHILSGSVAPTARYWDVNQTGKILELAHEKGIGAVAISPDNTYLLTGSDDGTAVLWSVASGQKIHTFSSERADFRAVAFSPSGTYALAGNSEGEILIRDIPGQKEVSLPGLKHKGTVWQLAFSPNGDKLISSGNDNAVKIWSFPESRLLHRENYSQSIRAVSFSPDGQRFVTAGLDSTVLGYDASTYKSVGQYFRSEGKILCVAYTPDGKLVAVSGEGGEIQMLDTETMKPVYNLPGHKGNVYALRFSPDGEYLYSAGHDQTIRSWHIPSQKLGIRLPANARLTKYIRYSPDGRQIMAADYSLKLMVWDKVDSHSWKLRYVSTPGVLATATAYSPDGTLAAVGTGLGEIHVFDTRSWELTGKFAGHQKLVSDLRFSPDGNFLVSGGNDQAVSYWELGGRHHTPLKSFTTDHAVVLAGIDDEGNIIAGDSTGTIIKYDIDSGEKSFHKLGNHSRIRLIEPSPDYLRALVADYEGRVFEYKIADRQLIQEFPGPAGSVFSLAYSRDGNYVLIGGPNRKAELWDVRARRLIQIFDVETVYQSNPPEEVLSVGFEPYHGRQILIGGSRGSAYIFQNRHQLLKEDFNIAPLDAIKNIYPELTLPK